MLGYHPPRSRQPPGSRHPQDQTHTPGPDTPQDQTPPWDQVHPPGPGMSRGTRYIPQDQVCSPGIRYRPQDQVHPPRPGTTRTRYTHLGPGTPSPPDQVHLPPSFFFLILLKFFFAFFKIFFAFFKNFWGIFFGIFWGFFLGFFFWIFFASPPPGSRLRHMVNERPIRIRLECILVFVNFRMEM